jgi:hypothetical protein
MCRHHIRVEHTASPFTCSVMGTYQRRGIMSQLQSYQKWIDFWYDCAVNPSEIYQTHNRSRSYTHTRSRSSFRNRWCGWRSGRRRSPDPHGGNRRTRCWTRWATFETRRDTMSVPAVSNVVSLPPLGQAAPPFAELGAREEEQGPRRSENLDANTRVATSTGDSSFHLF